MDKAQFVGVEISLGSRKVGVYLMDSAEYVKLRQLNALGQNNCFLPDEEGIARWARRAVNHYTGIKFDQRRIYPIPNMTTASYLERWKDFEVNACRVLGAVHVGFEKTGTIKGYIPDGLLFGTIPLEIKSARGMYRRGQVKK